MFTAKKSPLVNQGKDRGELYVKNYLYVMARLTSGEGKDKEH